MSGANLGLFGSLVGKRWSIPFKCSLFINSASSYSALIHPIMFPSCNIDMGVGKNAVYSVVSRLSNDELLGREFHWWHISDDACGLSSGYLHAPVIIARSFPTLRCVRTFFTLQNFAVTKWKIKFCYHLYWRVQSETLLCCCSVQELHP